MKIKSFINIDIDNKKLKNSDKKKIKNLLKKQNPSLNDEVEQIWYLMDKVWEKYKCDNQKLNWKNISKFYNHPVWILNGLFIEQHEISILQRKSIAKWLFENNITKIADYGGGFGTLARIISKTNKKSHIDIYEPHPSSYTLKVLKDYPNIKIINDLSKKYECIISTDVLEHVIDPLEHFYKMIEKVKKNGFLIIANCFEPVMQCHLPQTFHLKHTFNYFAQEFGLKNLGNLKGSHATIYKKTRNIKPNWENTKEQEKMSQYFFDYINKFIPKKTNKNLDFSFNLNKIIQNLNNLDSNLNYIIYGSGTGANLILNFSKLDISFILDKNENKHQTKMNDIFIYNPEKIKIPKDTIILISVFGREDTITKELQNKYNIAEKNIRKLL